MRDLKFGEGEFYHVYNRGVDKRDIFPGNLFLQRFYESLYLFNDKNYQRKRGDVFEKAFQLARSAAFFVDRVRFVSIVAFKLMTNHFHIVLREERENGVSEFMHRIGTGYTNFLNLDFNRSGSLFEGPFKAVHIQSDAQLEHVIRYAHLNELDRHGIPWREGKVEDWDRVLAILDADKYSSHGVYCGREQELPVVDLDLAYGFFPNPDEYREFLRSWSQSDIDLLPPSSFDLI